MRDNLHSLLFMELRDAESLERLSVQQYEAMIAKGILEEGAPVELLDGLLIRKDRSERGEDPMTVGTQHALAVKKLARLAPQFERLGCHLGIQTPIRLLPSSEPEPDGSVVTGKPEEYAQHHPGPDSVLSVIEVADSSLLRDVTTKLGIYAGAAINQYIIVNLIDRRIDIYNSPLVRERRYAGCVQRSANQVVAIAAGRRKYVKVKARDLLP